MKRFFLMLLFLLLGLEQVAATPEAISYGVEPSFSHDSSVIVYASMERGYRDIYMLDRSGKKEQLTEDIYWDGQPVFTPDGEAVVFISDRSGKRELWKIDLSLRNPVQLTKDGAWKSNPSVSAEGMIVFTAGRHPNMDIYLYDRGIVKKTTYLEDEIYSPIWSPDEKRIAFVRDGDLTVMNSDGTGLEILESEVYFRGLSWSVNDEILYIKRSNGYDIWRMHLKDRSKELIYSGISDSWEVNPAFSREGDIVFSTDKDGAYRVYLIENELSAAPIMELSEPLPVPVAEPAAAPSRNTVELSRPSTQSSDTLLAERQTNEEGVHPREINIPDDRVVPDEIIIPHDDVNSGESENPFHGGYTAFLLVSLAALVFILISQDKRRLLYRL